MENTMNKTIAAAIVALTVMLAGSASAEVLPDGKYSFTNGPAVLNVTLTKVRDSGKNGIYKVQTFSDGRCMYTADSNEGTAIEHRKEATLWELHKNSNGWNFMHIDNKANVVSNVDGKGTLQLRRNNGGGRGNADQLWQTGSR
jgi:hypothetical protein